MVRSKPSSSKKPKRGVDFKKIKHKIGRKLPPPKNATNTQIKSKAIILPEQSVASNREGLAVSNKGLTLRELLQQTSHHNAKIRKLALIGIRDIAIKYPSVLRLHKLAIIEKLRELICDNDKVVRETLYHLLKTVIFPGSKEAITGPIVSLMMAYVFNAMTHLAMDIRLMAFKFFDLIVHCYPSSFALYAEKVLDNYGDILRNNQMYLQDKSKIKNVLGGLVHCLSLLRKEKVNPSYEKKSLHAFDTEVPKEHTGISGITKKLEELVQILAYCFQEFTPVIHGMPAMDAISFSCMLCILQSINLVVQFYVSEMDHPHGYYGVSVPSLHNGIDMRKSTMIFYLKKLWEAFPISSMHHTMEKEDDRYFVLNVRITEIFLHLVEWFDGSVVQMEKFLEFIEAALYGQISSNIQPGKVLQDKHLVSVIPFIPGLVSQVTLSWKTRLLKAFTSLFKDCKLDLNLNLAFLSTIEEMLLPKKMQITLSPDSICQELLHYQVAWIQELPYILLRLGDKHPSFSETILKLLLHIGQCSLPNTPLALEYDNLQCQLREFYSTYLDQGTITFGPFVKLPKDCQELAICCLYYFSNLSSHFLESLALCCLYKDLEPYTSLRIIEVIHSAYKAGHVRIADHIGFLVTLVGRFKVHPERFCFGKEDDGKISNRRTFKDMSAAVCFCLSEMGDNALILKLLLKILLDEMALKPTLDNMQGMLKMIATLDSRPSKLPEEGIGTLSYFLFGYLIAAASYIPENSDETTHPDQIRIYQYYVRPSMFLFYRSDKLLSRVLQLLVSSVMKYKLSSSSQSGAKYDLETSSITVTVVSILIFMLKDVKLHQSLSINKEAIKYILKQIFLLSSSNKTGMSLGERHKIQCAFDRLKTQVGKLHCLDADDLQGLYEFN